MLRTPASLTKNPKILSFYPYQGLNKKAACKTFSLLLKKSYRQQKLVLAFFSYWDQELNLLFPEHLQDGTW